jgi:hypothetical protein
VVQNENGVAVAARVVGPVAAARRRATSVCIREKTDLAD